MHHNATVPDMVNAEFKLLVVPPATGEDVDVVSYSENHSLPAVAYY